MNRTITFISRAATTLVLMMLTTATAWAIDGITYIDENGEGQTANGVTVLSNGSTTLGAGWYVVSGTETDTKITIKGTVTLVGDVNIILADGATMNIGTSINRISGNGIDGDGTLTIYGQSGGTGALNVYTQEGQKHGISVYALTINGGNITAYNSGQGSYAIYAKDNVTVNRGSMTATATGQDSKGIYVEGIYDEGGNVTISGGNVTATGDCYGIWAKNNVTISGGNVNATYSGASSSDTDGIYAEGTITLGWTDYTDCIYASSYNSGNDVVTINGFLTDGNLLSGTVSTEDVAGKTLRPAVAYLDAGGNTKYATDYTLLTGSETVSNNGTVNLKGGWYIVSSDITYTGTITLTGDVNLILCDGYTMNMGTSGTPISSHGIKLEDGGDQSLTIYGQTNGTGALSIYTANSNILKGIVAKAVTINGGNITVNAHGDWSTAISAGNGDITINGGTVNVTASGDTNGWGLYANHNVTINGGKVEASGTSSGIRTDNNKPINLGWTNVTDRILANRYSGTLALADGKKLTDGTTTYTTTNELAAGDIAGKALYPYIENLALAANLAEGNYWTTFYCGHTGYKIDDGENAWTYTAEYDNTDPNAPQLKLHKLGKVIPKGTAVILVGEDNSISMTASTDAAENSVSNNLHGVDVKKLKSELDPSTDKSGKFYVMGKVNEVFGFFEYTGAYMPARKAYLLVNGGAAQGKELTMVFEEEDADGIRSLTPALSEGEGAIYNLAGQRLNKMQKGINIVNGKKVLK